MRSIGGFILALIGGIINIIWGFSFYRIFYYLNKPLGPPVDVKGVGELGGSIIVGELGGSISSGGNPDAILYWGIFILVWMVIMGILLIISAFKMKKDNNKSVMFGGIMALIASALSFNIFGIIGGIIGIVQAKKISK